jgi:hypothetical protein
LSARRLDVPEIDLDVLSRRYRRAPALLASQVLSWFPEDDSDEELEHLLRHHSKEGIETTIEVEMRDAFDKLIEFYSLVAVAWCSGALGAELPEPFRQEVRRHLAQPDVRRYYSKHYPLALPALLLRVIERKSKQGAAKAPNRNATMSLAKFLSLVDDAAADENQDCYLAMLDGYIIGGESWHDALAVLSDPEGLARAALASVPSPAERGALGFWRFLAFVSQFETLLRATQDDLLRSAMWHYYSYWFRHSETKFKRQMQMASKQAASWSREAHDRVRFQTELESGMSTLRVAVDYVFDRAHGRSVQRFLG